MQTCARVAHVSLFLRRISPDAVFVPVKMIFLPDQAGCQPMSGIESRMRCCFRLPVRVWQL